MSICLFHVEITDKISIEAFTTLLQTQAVSVRELDLRRAELREEDWQGLVGALRGKSGMIGWVGISRENLRRAAVGYLGSHKAEYCGLQHAYMHFGFCAEGVQKPRYDCWENSWAKLKQMSHMTEGEFYAHFTGLDEGTEGEGEEEESNDEDHDREDEEGGEEDGHD